jgi:hypothetical protein
MEKFSFLPDMSIFPDCEEKRLIENLAQKLELQLGKMTPDKDMDEVRVLNNKASETWWKMNATMGALVAKVAKESKQDRKWKVSIILSSLALIISILNMFFRS